MINSHSHQNKETAELYKIGRGNRHKSLQIDNDKLPKQWLLPADRAIATDTDNTREDLTPIKIYTDGSKSAHGVRAGVVMIGPETKSVKLMYRMDSGCTNNHAEAFTILKALEYIQNNQRNKEEDKVVIVHTDTRTTIDSLYNMDKHTFLTEEIRHKVHDMKIREWKIRFKRKKAHLGQSEMN
jgi:ribonuclease HI